MPRLLARVPLRASCASALAAKPLLTAAGARPRATFVRVFAPRFALVRRLAALRLRVAAAFRAAARRFGSPASTRFRISSAAASRSVTALRARSWPAAPARRRLPSSLPIFLANFLRTPIARSVRVKSLVPFLVIATEVPGSGGIHSAYVDGTPRRQRRGVYASASEPPRRLRGLSLTSHQAFRSSPSTVPALWHGLCRSGVALGDVQDEFGHLFAWMVEPEHEPGLPARRGGLGAPAARTALRVPGPVSPGRPAAIRARLALPVVTLPYHRGDAKRAKRRRGDSIRNARWQRSSRPEASRRPGQPERPPPSATATRQMSPDTTFRQHRNELPDCPGRTAGVGHTNATCSPHVNESCAPDRGLRA